MMCMSLSNTLNPFFAMTLTSLVHERNAAKGPMSSQSNKR